MGPHLRFPQRASMVDLGAVLPKILTLTQIRNAPSQAQAEASGNGRWQAWEMRRTILPRNGCVNS